MNRLSGTRVTHQIGESIDGQTVLRDRSMDSDEENDMVKRFNESELGMKADKGPGWSGQQTSWTAFWYDMYPFLKLCDLGSTVDGSDRHEKDDEDAKKRKRYERRSLKLWRYMYRAISDKTSEGKALRMKIKDDFGPDNDGYELVQYLHNKDTLTTRHPPT